MSEGSNDLGHGSFLDVITNMVGVLIILVVVLGMRIKGAPVKLPPDMRIETVTAELRQQEASEKSLRADVLKADLEMRTLKQAIQAKFVERTFLSTAVAAAEHELASRREQLDAKSQQQYDQSRQTYSARRELEQLRVELQTLANTTETVAVECYPTPISRAVDGEEMHFQLRNGRVTFVPMDELVRRFREDAQHKLYKLRDQAELTETIGPVGGFRMRYVLERRHYTEEEVLASRRGGTVISLKRYELIPLSTELGEPLEAALADGSEFRQALATAKPGRTTVTLWTYPDSFAAFRTLRQELFHRGFTIAGRPVPEDLLIGGSPEGSKSAAQ